MKRERDGLTIMEQLHMAALVTYTNNPLCVIDYVDAENGLQIIKGTVQYFTNTTVCLDEGRTITISSIRKITC